MDDHPLITWYSALKTRGAATVDGSDIVLNDLGGRRFGLSAAAGGIPVLCCGGFDLRTMRSIRWTSAAFVLAHKGRDWVALSSRDIRIPGSGEKEPVPLRVFIPVTIGRLDAWKERPPTRLRLSAMESGKGASRTVGETVAEIPLKVIGKWH